MSGRGVEAPTYVEPFLEFVEVILHQVLYHRVLYPGSIFVKRRKYRVPVWVSEHPWVNDYIIETLNSLSDYMKSPSPDLSSINILIGRRGTGGDRGGVTILERFCIEFKVKDILQAITVEDRYLVHLEMEFVTAILRLCQAMGDMGKPPGTRSTPPHGPETEVEQEEEEEVTWWLELGTTERGALALTHSLAWGLASAASETSGSDILPVVGLDEPIKFQLYVEQFPTLKRSD